jgi:hypothetical protein
MKGVTMAKKEEPTAGNLSHLADRARRTRSVEELRHFRRLLNTELELLCELEHRMVEELKGGGPYVKRGPRRGKRMQGASLSGWVSRLLGTASRMAQLIGAEHDLYVRAEELGESPWTLAPSAHPAPGPARVQ